MSEMREILFRGKREDDGTWAYGHYFPCVIKPGRKFYIVEQIEDNQFHRSINPLTLGQYTGLWDRNLVKIFEGDIAQFDDELVVIEWHEDDAMFYAVSLDGTNWTTNFSVISGTDLEVIGNVHDNPELLEGGQPC